MSQINLTEKLSLVIQPFLIKLGCQIIVCRKDGIVIFDSKNSQASVGLAALIGGITQALESMMKIVDSLSSPAEFRLGYDTSSDGILLLPLTIKHRDFFICAIYKNCENPGKLKREMVLLKDSIESFFLSLPNVSLEPKENRSGFLFKEITDAEMDRLFRIESI